LMVIRDFSFKRSMSS